jgi:hypothetical protein
LERLKALAAFLGQALSVGEAELGPFAGGVDQLQVRLTVGIEGVVNALPGVVLHLSQNSAHDQDENRGNQPLREDARDVPLLQGHEDDHADEGEGEKSAAYDEAEVHGHFLTFVGGDTLWAENVLSYTTLYDFASFSD